MDRPRHRRGEREVLIAFDLLLVLVVCLLLYAISARDADAPPDAFDVLRLVLAVAALAADGVALAAVAARIGEFGFSANKAAALGVNLLLLAHLGGTAWRCARFLKGAVRLPPWNAGRPPTCRYTGCGRPWSSSCSRRCSATSEPGRGGRGAWVGAPAAVWY